MGEPIMFLAMVLTVLGLGELAPSGNETVATKQTKVYYDRIAPEADPAPARPLAEKRRG